MKIKTASILPLALVTSLAALAFSGCTKQDRTDAGTAMKDAYANSKAAVADAWGDVKSFTFDKRDEFTKSAKAMSSKLDSDISQLRANYSEAKASASRKAAMDELKNAEADYKSKLDALGNASAATWDSGKQNVIAAWDRVQAAYYKARAE